MTVKKVTIIGLGLIGGSLAWALKKSGLVGEVFGVDLDSEAVAYALKEKMIDAGSVNLEVGVEDSDIVVIATYVGIIPRIAKTVASGASAKTIITDVGSVKRKIVEELESALPPHLHFVGGHPIAGTERSGVWAADFNLFQGKRCILTPNSKTRPEPIAKVKNIWESVGATVFTMDAETHDRIFGFVSHLPHVVAYALVNSIASQKQPPNMFDFGGGGLRDYTRIAASSPEMWSDIFLTNRGNVLESIQEFKKALEKIEGLIEKNNSEDLREELNRFLNSRQNEDR